MLMTLSSIPSIPLSLSDQLTYMSHIHYPMLSINAIMYSVLISHYFVKMNL